MYSLGYLSHLCFFKTIFVFFVHFKTIHHYSNVWSQHFFLFFFIVCMNVIIFGITYNQGESLLVSLIVFSFNELCIIKCFHDCVSFFSDMTFCLCSLWIPLSRIHYVCHIIFWRRRAWTKLASLSKLCWMRLRPARHSSHEPYKHKQVSLTRARAHTHTHTHTNTVRRSLRSSLDRVHLFLLEQVILSLLYLITVAQAIVI